MSGEEVKAQEIRIPVPWGHVAGCWYGSQQQRPLLAVHGWQDNAGTFARLAPLIAPHRAVLAVDMPGHGRSSHLPSGMLYHTLDYVHVLRHIMRHYKWPTMSLLGHSMGAVISFHFATLFSEIVDIIIAVDVFHFRCFEPNIQIMTWQYSTEKNVIDCMRTMKRQHDPNFQPAPVYTFAQLENMLCKGSDYSVELENCKYILERSITPLDNETDRYYFTRDSRIKYLYETVVEPKFLFELSERIKNVQYLLIKALDSNHFEADATVLELLRGNNCTVEQYDIPGTTHHVHLNNPDKVADVINPFLFRNTPTFQTMNKFSKL